MPNDNNLFVTYAFMLIFLIEFLVIKLYKL